MKNNELKIEVSKGNQQECLFRKVPASELRLDDEFMKYQPRNKKVQNFKKEVETVIKNGPKDFWRPVCDPSFVNDCAYSEDLRICYKPGYKCAITAYERQTFNWWEEKAKKYAPESRSRLGTKSEYIAFLAVLIKELVASGKSTKWAWNAVCKNSKDIAHCHESVFKKYENLPTGSKNVCGWYDLGNACKILAEDEENGGYWYAGVSFLSYSHNWTLASISYNPDRNFFEQSSCGWLVFDSCPDC